MKLTARPIKYSEKDHTDTLLIENDTTAENFSFFLVFFSTYAKCMVVQLNIPYRTIEWNNQLYNRRVISKKR